MTSSTRRESLALSPETRGPIRIPLTAFVVLMVLGLVPTAAGEYGTTAPPVSSGHPSSLTALALPSPNGGAPSPAGFSGRPVGAGNVAELAEHFRAISDPSATAGGGRTAAISQDGGRPPPPAGATPMSSPRPGASGTVQGSVRDWNTGRPISGANITVLPEPALACGGVCPTSTTGVTGTFSLIAASGLALLEVDAPHYLGNRSILTVPSTSTISVGTILLEHDGYAIGRLLGSDPSHEPIAQGAVTLLPASRDSTLLGTGGMLNASNGSFRAELPPLPDYIEFQPVNLHGPYVGNTTFVDPAPNQTVDLGTIYLTRGTPLDVELIDRVSGSPISPIPDLAIYSCNAITGNCPFRPPAENGSVWAVPGPTLLKVIVAGYVTNDTSIGTVPAVPRGISDPVRVEITPDTIVRFETNVTGGLARSLWNSSSSSSVDVCSLDNIATGYDVNYTGNDSARAASGNCPKGGGGMPAWNSYVLFRPRQEILVPPLRSLLHFPGTVARLPLYWNETWVNGTPSQLVDIGEVNFTPGGLLEGSVFAEGSSAAPAQGFTVSACSTDIGGLCGDPTAGGTDCSGRTNATRFCDLVPFGPIELSVDGPNEVANRTWAEVPARCCNLDGQYVTLANTTNPRIRSINLSALGIANVFGRVMLRLPGGGSGPAVSAEVRVCPVEYYFTGIACQYTLTDPNGSFSASVNVGWQSVNVGISQFSPNATWVYAASNNSTGTIWLGPQGELLGRAVAPDGTPVVGAVVEVCPASQPLGCQALGSGTTSEGGIFSGWRTGGSFPGNAVRIEVDATGFSPGSSWANVTDGTVVDVGSVVLVPVGSAPRFAERSAAGPAATSSWLEGRVVDNRTGNPVPTYTLSVCPVLGAASCATFPQSPTPGFGAFNGSLPSGPANLSVQAPGYAPWSETLNVSGVSLDVGAIALTRYPRVTGEITFGPWSELSAVSHLAPTFVPVRLCDPLYVNCGPPSVPASDGRFNVSGPAGPADVLTVTALGTAAYSASYPGGVNSYSDTVYVPWNGTVYHPSGGGPIVLTLDSVLVGRLGDGSTYSSLLRTAIRPASYLPVEAVGPGLRSASNSSGDGIYRFLAPPGDVVSVRSAGAAFWRAGTMLTASKASATTKVTEIDLPHFGWVQLHARTAQPPAPAPNAGLQARVWDAGNASYVFGHGSTSDDGFGNLSAPPGTNVTVTVSSPGVTSVSTVVAVYSSATTQASLPPLNSSASGLWLRSWEVNTVGAPPTVTVRDPKTVAPLSGASVLVENAQGQIAESPVATNGLGQFLLSAPPLPGGSFGVAKPGYVTAGFALPRPSGLFLYRTINLTGFGVVAGGVTDGQTGLPVAGATVTGCSTAPPYACVSAPTNTSGGYWLSLPPGGVLLSFNAAGYVLNQSYQTALCSDCFVLVPTLPVWRDSEIIGSVLSNPFGDPIAGAEVTLCPVGFLYSVYCQSPLLTNGSGTFDLFAPGGEYTLNVSSPGYAPLQISLATVPGELVRIGALYLLADGHLVGTVLSGATGAPLAGVTIVLCPGATASPCVATLTNGSGDYRAESAPGEASITASLPGYLTEVAAVSLIPASTVTAPTIALPFLGPGQPFRVDGTVSSDGRPVPSAVIQALVGASPVGSTVSGAAGTFALELGWGVYLLSASAPGFSVSRVPLTVHGPVGGLAIDLSRFNWSVTGVVSDAYDHAPLPGSRVNLSGGLSATADALGRFVLDLPNGSYAVDVAPPGAQAGLLERSSTMIAVNGAPLALSFELALVVYPVTFAAFTPGSTSLLGGVSYALNGTLALGPSYAASIPPAPSGATNTSLPAGTYQYRASVAGRLSVTGDFSVQDRPITVRLEIPSSGPTAGGSFPVSSSALVAGLAIAGAVGAFLGARAWRRRRPPRSDEEPPGEAGPEGPESPPPEVDSYLED